ncbi:MAG: nitric oxide reductase NorQ protein [Verrucomicrobiota bacterium]|jgi:predicted metallo-beta-lactamase superfamily hydrolase|nr:nitric oxide reductase NorQ protein [Verrucomicrobiota bacterium]MDK2964232.1 nitric oxide reductase NorQ protein [Verrucomicrobiota bacterium]
MHHPVDSFRIRQKPNYVPQSDEEKIFQAAYQSNIPIILKGPTGCGKTRFIEFIAYKLDLPLITVSCHEDLTAADLVGRFLLKNEETVWQDGPLTLAVRYGGICYLDEIVEARKDTTVIIHSLTDDRRILYIDKTGEVIQAQTDFVIQKNTILEMLSRRPCTINDVAAGLGIHRAELTRRDLDHHQIRQAPVMVVPDCDLVWAGADCLIAIEEKEWE